MYKKTKQLASVFLAAVCVFASISGYTWKTVAYAQGNMPKENLKVRYELEDGRAFQGVDAEREIWIKTGDQFSGGKAIDTMDHNGLGAGVEIAPEIEKEGTYSVALGYSKGSAYPKGKIALYKNEERVGYFELATTGTSNPQPVTVSEEIDVELAQGDKLSIRSDLKDLTQAVACFDYLEVIWRGNTSLDKKGSFISRLFSIVVGDSLTIPYQGVAQGEVLRYTSSQVDVAGVDPKTGKITAIGEGETTITAYGTVDTEVKFSCIVRVVKNEEEIRFSADNYEAEEGTFINGAASAPIVKEGSWASGGKWVELYDAGTGAAVVISPQLEMESDYALTMVYGKGDMYPSDKVCVYVDGKKVGEFELQPKHIESGWDSNTIVARLRPGSEVMVKKDSGYNSLFRYDYLKVEQLAVCPVRNIHINDASVEVPVQEKRQISYKFTPVQATDDLVWSSSDPKVAQVSGGTVTGLSEGKAVITAVSRYNPDIYDTVEVVVTGNDAIETIRSSQMEVVLDKNYPGVLAYKLLDSGNVMEGSRKEAESVKINGKEYQTQISFELQGEDTAVYTLEVPELEAGLTFEAKVDGTVLKFDCVELKESEDKTKRIYTVELPDQILASAGSFDEGSEFAGTGMNTDIRTTGDEFFAIADAVPKGEKAYNYAFVTNGKVAAGLYSNAYNVSDGRTTSRIFAETYAEGNGLRTGLRSGSWVWRRQDYTKKFIDLEGKYGPENEIVTKTYQDTPEKIDLPLVYVALAEDLNDTGTVDWQDAAISFRSIMPVSIGMDKIPDAVVQRLIMPQGGEGNYPFISSLDETKRMYQNTDGLGQIILDKYHNLGFWADFSVYDDHLGGLQDFNKFVTDATNKYNGFVGVHSNFTEVFAKTGQFSTESIQMNSAGTQPVSKGYKQYGFYLHQCYNADDTWESMSGQRRESLAMFKRDVPDLGFVYSDVWPYNGWRGKQLSQDYISNGLAFFMEATEVVDTDGIWAHWSVDKGYAGIGGRGYASEIARFIFNHTKDCWDNNSNVGSQRYPNSANLLMGADTTAYEGWNHDGNNQFDYCVQKVFNTNLPTKYMQHFPIIRMEHDEEGWCTHVWFEDNVEVFLDENEKRVITKDGKLVYTEDAYLLPWNEGNMQVDDSLEEKEVKLYHYNEKGGTTTWQLPDSWDGLQNVYVYKLTDQGRTEEIQVSVVDGTVTLTAQKQIPYVVYKEEAVLAEDVNYGDGGFVKDPGFNYGDLREWTVDFGDAKVVKNDGRYDSDETLKRYNGNLRNFELIIDSTDAAQVSQTVEGLIPGAEYAASVMVEVQQDKERKASIVVDCGDTRVENYITKSIMKMYDAYDPKASTYMQRMRVVFTVPEGETTATVRVCAAEGEGLVRFDNIRVYDTTTPEALEGAGKVVFYQDYEYGTRTDAPVRAENKVTFEGYYPFVLGGGGGIREARTMLQAIHAPYTQNNENAGWDNNTIMVDMVLAGEHSLSIITDSLGAAFQTMPQNIRFEKGHTYRVSFLYQNALDDTFAFVLGVDKSTEPVYQESLKATPAKTGSRVFTHEFTSTSDQTWFSINRVDSTVKVTDNPNPFVIDNILVEDLSQFYTVTAAENENAVITVPEQSVAGEEIGISVEVKGQDKEIDKVVVTGKSGSAVEVTKQSASQYSFLMPAEDVTVTVVLKNKAADKSALASAIELADEKLETSYTAESWKMFADALAAAKAANDKQDAAQSEVNKALEDLTAAMKGLVRLPEAADKSALNAVIRAALTKRCV